MSLVLRQIVLLLLSVLPASLIVVYKYEVAGARGLHQSLQGFSVLRGLGGLPVCALRSMDTVLAEG